jgi:predicted oxidoreductase
VYGGYKCEALFGDIIKKKSFKREDIVLFSKCGLLLPDTNRPNVRIKHHDTSSKHITESVNNSLQNLKTDFLDIFLLDGIDPLSNLEEAALTLERLRTSAK